MIRDTAETKRLKSEQSTMKPIRNADLICKDCVFRLDDSEIYGNTSRCMVYKQTKPNSVLKGENCAYFTKEGV